MLESNGAPASQLERAVRIVRLATQAIVASVYVLLALVVVAQVFFRYVLNDSLDWAEEFSRYALLWSVLLGAALVSEKREHVNVDFLRETLPQKRRYALDLLNAALVLLLCGLLVWYGLAFARRAVFAISPAAGYPMWIVYLAMPIGGALIALFTFASLLKTDGSTRDDLAAAEREGL